MMKTIKIAYVLFAVVIGIACFYGLITIAFSIGYGLFSRNDPALATWTGIAVVLGVGGYWFLGMKLDRKLLPAALSLMIFGLFTAVPALQLYESLKDTWKKNYASKHEDPYVVQIDRILQNSELPMKLNLKSSNYDTLYYEGSTYLNVEKTTEEPVAKAELNTLLNLLPEAAKERYISVVFGSHHAESGKQESSVSFIITPDKELENCDASPGYESLCYRYDKQTGFDPSEVIYITSRSINDTLPPFMFTVYGVEKENLSNVTRITITNASDNEFIQELIFDETSTQDDQAFGLVLEDMNFDGYLDVRIQAGTPAGPNIPYHCWLWDAEKAEFVRNSFLEEITSPEFDANTKLINSSGRSSAAEYFIMEYKYIKDIPKMTKMTEERIDPEQKSIHTKVWDITDGKFKLIKDTTVPYVEGNER